MRGTGAGGDGGASGLTVGEELSPKLPHGVALVFSPAGPAMLWHDVIALDGGRTGVSIGTCADAGTVGRLRTEIRDSLRDAGDPFGAFGARTGDVNALSMVVDPAESRIACAGVGDGAVIVAQGDRAEWVAASPVGPRLESALHPGATLVVLVGGLLPDCRVLPDDCGAMRPEEAAEQIIERLPSDAKEAVVVLVYRQPPDALSVSMPADPNNLAVIRAQLRRWLAAAAVDPETSADALLAVGEAASNSAEHAVLAAGRRVELSVHASLAAGRLRFEVSDNGRWRPPPDSPGHRGHGLRLIRALVDAVELKTSDQGTTVEMLKELEV